ncbi:MAG: exo-alpha-sialidase [Marinospirillum sp.]|uniref:hypothetical protein n=1 Tax=Marinospirillum sp. TaxID=2183934 RepID=UPI001A01C35F|nr:hypothetical protein [Marinospirillum sp.]MBE0508407.1 exo-alpha-sialidase [Marinospirillum sp.]
MKLLSCNLIWNQAPHNAFTDLIRFNEHWYCAFREGENHISDDGCLRILASPDGLYWHSVALLSHPDGDLRDADFSVTADGQLLLLGAVRLLEPVDGFRHQSLSWLSRDGLNWSEPCCCPQTGLGTWRWSASWHGGQGYSVAYSGRDREGTLYSTRDGRCWQPVRKQLFPEPDTYANEASLAFDDDATAWCLLRRDGGDAKGWLGHAVPPYLDWQWQVLSCHVGGPKLLRLSDGRLMAAVRLINFGEKTATTALCQIDQTSGEVHVELTLPSGGDTSYAGLVEYDGELWISYYSSHEEQTAIYLARVAL